MNAELPTTVIGWRDDSLVADVAAYDRCRHLYGDGPYQWRSGIKHDCARVMEFRKTDGGYQNGLGELVDLESRFLFPLLKSSDLARAVVNQPSRVLLVPQRRVGEETDRICELAPKTWRYLQQHADRLNRRASCIYKNRPPFSVFGVGPYSFSPWKVAISGFYKQLTFNAVGPFGNKPVVFDDTCNFVPCESEAEATLVAELLNSELAQDALSAYVFWDMKRPVTIELLRRLDLRKLSDELGLTSCRPTLFRPTVRPGWLPTTPGPLERDGFRDRCRYRTSP